MKNLKELAEDIYESSEAGARTKFLISNLKILDDISKINRKIEQLPSSSSKVSRSSSSATLFNPQEQPVFELTRNNSQIFD